MSIYLLICSSVMFTFLFTNTELIDLSDFIDRVAGCGGLLGAQGRHKRRIMSVPRAGMGLQLSYHVEAQLVARIGRA